MALNLLSVLETVKILKLESEQITKKLDLLIVHLVENQINDKVEFIYAEIIKQEKQSISKIDEFENLAEKMFRNH